MPHLPYLNSFKYQNSNNHQMSDSNEIRTHNYLIRKGILNHLANLAKWLSCVVSSYLYGGFDCMLLSFHERDSE